VTAIRFSLITEREALYLPRAAGTFLLCLLTSAWLHLLFFAAWEALAGDGPGLFRLELPAPAAPLEMVLTLEAEEDRPAVELSEASAEPPVTAEAETTAALAEAEEPTRDQEIDPALTRAQLRPAGSGPRRR